MEFRDLKKQYQALKEDIDNAILQVAGSGQYIMGDSVNDLENDLKEYVGVKHCVTCANGTDALTLALKVWGIGVGDAVFVPDFTFFSSAEVVCFEGATPVFVDVESRTYNISAPKLEQAILNVINKGKLKPKVIIAVDLFGLPANYPAICEIAQKYNLLILEDGAQGFGGCIQGRRACSFGDISTTSFFPAKPLGCYGDGGALFTNNDEWATLAGSYRIHGKGCNKYDNVRIGMNSRLDSIQAAILRVKLKAFRDYELDAVNQVANHYTHLLNEIVNTPVIPNGFYSSWAQYTIRLVNQEQRDGLQKSLKERGIPSMVYYPKPMHQQTAFTPSNSIMADSLNVSSTLCKTVLSLPMHPYLTEDSIYTVTDSITGFFR